MPTFEASYPPLYHARTRSRRRWSRFSRRDVGRVVNAVSAMVVVWIYVLAWGERGVFKRAVRDCAWDKWEKWPSHAVPERVVLIADPQLVDDHTYAGRNSVLLRLTEFYVDKYMHRAWTDIDGLEPTATIFLGDLFDGGREWEHDKWVAEFRRFQRVFPVRPGRLVLFETAGNHDIGLGDTIVVPALRRFSAYFGEPNRQLDIGNHSFVILDTNSLMNKHDEDVYGAPRAFFDSLLRKPGVFPTILISHIPLYRSPDSPCGPKRERGVSIPIERGYQYQNVLDSDLTDTILHKLHPAAIFSGDDHDACEHIHEYAEGRHSTVEYTVKTFSIAMGVSRPAFELISLWNPRDGSHPTFQTKLCLLPSQFDIFRRYFYVLVLSLVVLYAAALKSYRKREKRDYGLSTLWQNKWVLRIWGRPGTLKNEFQVRLTALATIVLAVYFWLLLH